MDAAEEVDDDRAGGGGLGDALAEQREGEQQAQARAGVGLEQEQDRLAGVLRLGGAQRGQDALVDGVVQEQDLGRLDEDRGQRQQAVGDQGVDDVRGEPAERLDEGAGDDETDDR